MMTWAEAIDYIELWGYDWLLCRAGEHYTIVAAHPGQSAAERYQENGDTLEDTIFALLEQLPECAA